MAGIIDGLAWWQVTGTYKFVFSKNGKYYWNPKYFFVPGSPDENPFFRRLILPEYGYESNKKNKFLRVFQFSLLPWIPRQ